MAQADGVVDNGSGATVRADLNTQLAAIFSNNSGATAPTTTYAYMWWADTTAGLLKQRNASNTAWVTIGTLASTNLGLATVASLGTAAFLNVGTSANNVVQLNGSSQLPAVDGSLLTGLQTSDLVARDQIALSNIRIMLSTSISTGALVQGKQWELLTDEWSSGSSGYTFTSSSINYYGNPTGTGFVSGATGTPIGNMTANGGLAASFDGNTSQALASCSEVPGASTQGDIGKDWGVGNTKTITGIEVYGSSNGGFAGGGDATVTITLRGSNDNSSWTDLGSGTIMDSNGVVFSKTSGFTQTPYRYHMVNINHGLGSSTTDCAELKFYEATSPSNMVLLSPSVTLASSPSYADAYFLYKDDDGSSVLGTDITVELSRDGANWVTATLTSPLGSGGYDGTYGIIKARANLSGQPSGTSLKGRIKTFNSKSQRIAAPSLYAE